MGMGKLGKAGGSRGMGVEIMLVLRNRRVRVVESLRCEYRVLWRAWDELREDGELRDRNS
jgi:hypothetical protein